MKKPVVALRFNDKKVTLGLILEQLRYAGIISKPETDDQGVTTIKIYSPTGVRPAVWADMNSRRMQSFGLHAVVEKVEF
jgi:hypothetical protein